MTPLPWLIGIMALFSMVPEGAVLDWGALYLKDELGASVELSGFGFAAFSATMAAMRFAGDHVRDRLGATLTLRICTVTALAGMVLAGLAPNAVLAILGFALAGIGISNMVPIAFSAAGNMPGLQPGIGLSVATTMGYSGMLFAPSLTASSRKQRLRDHLRLRSRAVHRGAPAFASRRSRGSQQGVIVVWADEGQSRSRCHQFAVSA